jgi:hypothetical protein
VWFAAVAFTLLLVEPEIGSSDSQIVKGSVESVPVAECIARTEANAASWYAYRAASRQEPGSMPDPKRAAVAPVPLR